MAVELFANNAESTLNGGITAIATSLIVNSATSFPSSGNFRILVDSEIMLVTGVSGSTFTVTRASESTSAAAHANAATVTHIVTKGSLNQVSADDIAKGVDASLPSAAKEGRVYIDTDSLYWHHDSGAAWTAFGPIFKLTKPVSGDFSWVNQGGATVTTTYGSVILNAPASASDSLRARVKSATAPYTVTAMLLPMFDDANFASAGLCFSNGTAFHCFDVAYDTGMVIRSTKFTDSTTFSAHYTSTAMGSAWGGIPRFMRIADDNSNRICSLSHDGINFQTFHTIGRTDFLTATQVGFYANSVNSVAVSCHLLSWLQA